MVPKIWLERGRLFLMEQLMVQSPLTSSMNSYQVQRITTNQSANLFFLERCENKYVLLCDMQDLLAPQDK